MIYLLLRRIATLGVVRPKQLVRPTITVVVPAVLLILIYFLIKNNLFRIKNYLYNYCFTFVYLNHINIMAYHCGGLSNRGRMHVRLSSEPLEEVDCFM